MIDELKTFFMRDYTNLWIKGFTAVFCLCIFGPILIVAFLATLPFAIVGWFVNEIENLCD